MRLTSSSSSHKETHAEGTSHNIREQASFFRPKYHDRPPPDMQMWAVGQAFHLTQKTARPSDPSPHIVPKLTSTNKQTTVPFDQQHWTLVT